MKDGTYIRVHGNNILTHLGARTYAWNHWSPCTTEKYFPFFFHFHQHQYSKYMCCGYLFFF